MLEPLYAAPSPSSKPLPRFVSLGADEVNLHVGPGLEYPISWRYVRLNFPVEILREFDTWRHIRDVNGEEGWVHKTLLSGKRYALVINQTQILYVKPEHTSDVLAHLKPGVLVKLISCGKDWCKVSCTPQKNLKGWIQRKAIWGLYVSENTF